MENENTNQPSKIVGIDFASGPDRSVTAHIDGPDITIINTGEPQSIRKFVADWNAQRAQALGISPELLTAHETPSHSEFAMRRERVLNKQLMANSALTDMLYAAYIRPVRQAVKATTKRGASARVRKAAVQARIKFKKFRLTWTWSVPEIRVTRMKHPQFQQIPKSPTGRLNISDPDRQEFPKPKSRLHGVLKLIREGGL